MEYLILFILICIFSGGIAKGIGNIFNYASNGVEAAQKVWDDQATDKKKD